MVKSNKSSISSRKHEDRELAGKSAFEASTVEIQTPQTMILLLASNEDMVVLKAIASLDKYASRLEQNAQVLFDAGILKLLIPLLEHTELYIKRFATKLLSELNYLRPVADILLEDEIIPFMMEVLNNSTDFVIKEFASSIIAELTRSNSGLTQLLKTKLITILPRHLKVPDPDIQKNCLQIISNMVQDSFNHSTLTQQTDFDIKTFIELLLSEYVAIQNLTLDILDILTRQTKGNTVPTDFQNVGGVALLLKILKNFEWKDIHSKCLEVLCNIYNDPKIAQHFLKDGVLQLFNYIKFINDAQLRKKAVEAIAKIAETPLGRKMLTESGHISELEGMLLEQSAGLAGAVSSAISRLVQDYQALQQVLECDTVSDLLTVIVDESQGWVDKAAAVNALYQILKRDINACSNVIVSDKVDVIASVLSLFKEGVPTHVAVSAANCISTIASNAPELKQRIINKHLISSLLHCFEDFEEDTTLVKLSACEALCSLLSEQETRSLLRDMDGLSRVWASITKHPNNTQFLQAAANFVHLCVANDVGFTNNILKIDAINWLLSQSSFRNECPTWEIALETVLNKFLPLKFAMTGRLDLTDVTENGFYITRVGLSQEQLKQNKFPNIIELIENKCCPTQTLYFANFTDNSNYYNGSGFSKLSTSSPIKMSSSESSSTFSNSLDCNKFWLADSYLQNYLHSLSSILELNGFSAKETKSRDSVVDGETIRKKATLIGQFVANQMSGLDASEVCSSHTLDLHINELKVEIMNNMIPIGWMRTGLHLERAFLFKVLADQLGLPASLVRGIYLQRAWIEVAIPNIPPAPRPNYPNYLLKPNYIVDLMSSPGTLYPLKSYQSDLYCGYI